MNLLTLSLLIGGFTASAEFGSVLFVHPVIRTLPSEEHIKVEQGMLRTFGRAMPALMTGTTFLAGLLAAQTTSRRSSAAPLLRAAALSATAGLLSTIIVNVPINQATGKWNPSDPPADWKATRNRWEIAQGVRASLFLLGFGLTCLATTLRNDR